MVIFVIADAILEIKHTIDSRVPPHGSQISEAEKYWIVPDPTFVRLPWLEFST